jgi:hypothetical protein
MHRPIATGLRQMLLRNKKRQLINVFVVCRQRDL